MTGPEPDTTVVIPAFDEEGRLGATLSHVHAWLTEREESFEVIVVDDGSRDGTVALAGAFAERHAEVRVVGLPRNRGKGAAVRRGLAESRGRWVLFSDADLSTPIEELPRLRAEVEAGCGLAIASRDLPESRLPVRQAWYRQTMGRLFNRIVRVVTGIPFLDTQCGFKLARGDDARALAAEMREDGFAFDVEMILLACRRGLRVREVPVTWRHVEASRVSPVADAFQMLSALPRILARTGRYRA